jgi:hypothetical protein
MQPILEAEAEHELDRLLSFLKTRDLQALIDIAEEFYELDVNSYESDDPDGPDFDGTDWALDADDIIGVIEGRILAQYADAGLAKFYYIDHKELESYRG